MGGRGSGDLFGLEEPIAPLRVATHRPPCSFDRQAAQRTAHSPATSRCSGVRRAGAFGARQSQSCIRRLQAGYDTALQPSHAGRRKVPWKRSTSPACHLLVLRFGHVRPSLLRRIATGPHRRRCRRNRSAPLAFLPASMGELFPGCGAGCAEEPSRRGGGCAREVRGAVLCGERWLVHPHLRAEHPSAFAHRFGPGRSLLFVARLTGLQAFPQGLQLGEAPQWLLTGDHFFWEFDRSRFAFRFCAAAPALRRSGGRAG